MKQQHHIDLVRRLVDAGNVLAEILHDEERPQVQEWREVETEAASGADVPLPPRVRALLVDVAAGTPTDFIRTEAHRLLIRHPAADAEAHDA